jgi:hypothetical protein
MTRWPIGAQVRLEKEGNRSAEGAEPETQVSGVTLPG